MPQLASSISTAARLVGPWPRDIANILDAKFFLGLKYGSVRNPGSQYGSFVFSKRDTIAILKMCKRELATVPQSEILHRT